MKAIRVKVLPPGNEPRNMREAWLDVCIPLPTKEELKILKPQRRVLKEEFVVSRAKAVAALKRAHRFGAAAFWESYGDQPFFRFRKKLCQKEN